MNNMKTQYESEQEYIKEVKRTIRKNQLADFVHFYYTVIDELTFNQAVEAFNKLPYEETN